MDFNSFIRFLAIQRWTRLVGYICGGIFFLIITYYFAIEQANHRQLVWNFRNISNLHAGSLTLDSGRIYEIRWEEYKAHPVEIEINGEPYVTMNYFKVEPGSYETYDGYLNVYVTNPVRIRVDRDTRLGIKFKVVTSVSLSSSLGDFLSDWFTSLGDPVAPVNWTVTDVTETKPSASLLFDGDLESYIIK